MPDHNTGNSMSYSLRIVCGFFNFPQLFFKDCETGPPAYSPYPRRLESLNICWCNYKGSTFYSVILRPWVLVRPESNSRPPSRVTAKCTTTEPPVRGVWREIILIDKPPKTGVLEIVHQDVTLVLVIVIQLFGHFFQSKTKINKDEVYFPWVYNGFSLHTHVEFKNETASVNEIEVILSHFLGLFGALLCCATPCFSAVVFIFFK